MAALVIGVGNELRADDRAGREVADRVAALDLPGVTVRSVIQLVPELALDLAAVDQVVFVDAAPDLTEVTVSEIAAPGMPQPDRGVSHHATPESLLALAASAGGQVPAVAHVVAVPVSELGFGEQLSPTTAAAVERAVEVVASLVTNSDGASRPGGS